MVTASNRNLFILLLTIVCGCVDAIGYLAIGHVFTANMTGNIVLVGFAIGHAPGYELARPLTSLLGFWVGNAVATLIVGRNNGKEIWPRSIQWVLLIESVVLILFAIYSHTSAPNTFVEIVFLSISMGIQTTAVRRIGYAGITTTVLTSTMATVVEDIVKKGMAVFRAKRGAAKGATLSLSENVMRALVVVMYGVGALIGALTIPSVHMDLVWFPIVLLLAIALSAVVLSKDKVKKYNQQNIAQ